MGCSCWSLRKAGYSSSSHKAGGGQNVVSSGWGWVVVQSVGRWKTRGWWPYEASVVQRRPWGRLSIKFLSFDSQPMMTGECVGREQVSARPDGWTEGITSKVLAEVGGLT